VGQDGQTAVTLISYTNVSISSDTSDTALFSSTAKPRDWSLSNASIFANLFRLEKDAKRAKRKQKSQKRMIENTL
jgi:hypothetical protein